MQKILKLHVYPPMAEEQNCHIVGKNGVTKITDCTPDIDNIVTRFQIFGRLEDGRQYKICEIIGLPIVAEYENPEEIK